MFSQGNWSTLGKIIFNRARQVATCWNNERRLSNENQTDLRQRKEVGPRTKAECKNESERQIWESNWRHSGKRRGRRQVNFQNCGQFIQNRWNSILFVERSGKHAYSLLFQIALIYTLDLSQTAEIKDLWLSFLCFQLWIKSYKNAARFKSWSLRYFKRKLLTSWFNSLLSKNCSPQQEAVPIGKEMSSAFPKHSLKRLMKQHGNCIICKPFPKSFTVVYLTTQVEIRGIKYWWKDDR